MVLPFTYAICGPSNIIAYSITKDSPLDRIIQPSVDIALQARPIDAHVTPDLSKVIYFNTKASPFYCIDTAGNQLWTHTLETHGFVTNSTLSRDGSLFWFYESETGPPEAVVQPDRKGTLKAIDVATGNLVAQTSLGHDHIEDVEITSHVQPVDGSVMVSVLTSNSDHMGVYFARCSQGTIELTPFPSPICAFISFSPDRTQCLTVGDNNESLQVQSYPDGAVLRSIPAEDFKVPNGFITGGSGGYIDKDTAAVCVVGDHDRKSWTITVDLRTGRPIGLIMMAYRPYAVFGGGDGSWLFLDEGYPSRHTRRSGIRAPAP